jgi:hypothetical protein
MYRALAGEWVTIVLVVAQKQSGLLTPISVHIYVRVNNIQPRLISVDSFVYCRDTHGEGKLYYYHQLQVYSVF